MKIITVKKIEMKWNEKYVCLCVCAHKKRRKKAKKWSINEKSSKRQYDGLCGDMLHFLCVFYYFLISIKIISALKIDMRWRWVLCIPSCLLSSIYDANIQFLCLLLSLICQCTLVNIHSSRKSFKTLKQGTNQSKSIDLLV